LISGLTHPTGIAIVGSDLFVLNGGSSPNAGSIGQYTLSGATVNASLISGLDSPTGIAASGSDLFVTSAAAGTVGHYTASGTTVNASLLSGLNTPFGIAVSGGNLYVASQQDGTIGKYTTSGGTVNPSLVSGLIAPAGIAINGSDLFVATDTDGSVGYLGEYTIYGATINPTLNSSLDYPIGVVVASATGSPTPPPPNNSPLHPTLSGRLPAASLVAGSKIPPITQIVRVTNNSTATFTGNLTLSLLLSTDPTGASGGTPVASVIRRTSLKAAKFMNVPLTIRSLPADAVGNLYILSQVTDPSGNISISASATTISAAAPFVDLQPIGIHVPASAKAGRKGLLSVTLINNGNTAAGGNLSIDLQASSSGAIDGTSIDLGTIIRHVLIQPGRKLTLELSAPFAAPAGTYFIIANADPADSFNESTLSNNLLASHTALKLT
jgi:hypothetical protein